MALLSVLALDSALSHNIDKCPNELCRGGWFSYIENASKKSGTKSDNWLGVAQW
jgi:hypothetical protein